MRRAEGAPPDPGSSSALLRAVARELALSTRDGLAILDPDGRLVEWNPAARAITGWDRDAAASREIGALPDGISEIRERKWIDARRITVPTEGGVHTAILFSDCTAQLELREANRRLEEIGLVDPVTRLPKQALAADHIARSLSLAIRENRAVGVLSVRIAGSASDDDGSDPDDQVAREIAARLLKTVRASDLVARTGPDAFAVVLTQMRDANDGAIVAARLLVALGRPFLAFGGRERMLGCAIGVSRGPLDGMSAEELLRKAQTAMSQAATGDYRIWGMRRS